MRIIAELCQNHQGNRETLAEMVSAAARAGATHAKIQGLYSDELTFRPEFEEHSSSSNGLVRPFDAEKNRLSKLDLDEETERFFVLQCHQAGIIPMITVFTHDGVDRAKRSGFRSFKIASYDCASRPMIARLLPSADEVIVSTGGTHWSEVVQTSNLLRETAPSNCFVALLHARTIYPTPTNALGLSRMLALASLGYEYGLSDHTSPGLEGLAGDLMAIFLGATVIERHFTILEKDQTRDGVVSVNEEELREIASFSSLNKLDQMKEAKKVLEDFPQILDSPILEPSPDETLNASYYRGRVATVRSGSTYFGWEAWPFEDENA